VSRSPVVTGAGQLAEVDVATRAFPGRPEYVRDARTWVAGLLPGSPAAADVTLMVSELFTNSVLYSASRLPGGHVTVAVRTGDGSVRVDVIDQGAAPDGVAAPSGLGVGLPLVGQLADAFGCKGADHWFVLSDGGAR
jgi:anti-sigma regulatory factor (Ser/Thr protein kinase)